MRKTKNEILEGNKMRKGVAAWKWGIKSTFYCVNGMEDRTKSRELSIGPAEQQQSNETKQQFSQYKPNPATNIGRGKGIDSRRPMVEVEWKMDGWRGIGKKK